MSVVVVVTPLLIVIINSSLAAYPVPPSYTANDDNFPEFEIIALEISTAVVDVGVTVDDIVYKLMVLTVNAVPVKSPLRIVYGVNTILSGDLTGTALTVRTS